MEELNFEGNAARTAGGGAMITESYLAGERAAAVPLQNLNFRGNSAGTNVSPL